VRQDAKSWQLAAHGRDRPEIKDTLVEGERLGSGDVIDAAVMVAKNRHVEVEYDTARKKPISAERARSQCDGARLRRHVARRGFPVPGEL
jgi:hypothetical protein